MCYTAYMNYDFYVSSTPTPSLLLTLKGVSIYQNIGSVFMRYDEPHNPSFVAIRTFSGFGIVSSGPKNNYSVTEGSLLLLRTDGIRSIELAGEDLRVYCFEFLGGQAVHLPLNCVLACKKRPYEEPLYEECTTLLKSQSAGTQGAASSIVAMLLQVWLQMCEPSLYKAPHWERIEYIREYIHVHLNENISIPNLARIVDLSERHFRDLFRQQVGLSPKQYLQNLRILRAEKDLLDLSYSIKEISQRLGYSNQFHFNRAFREVHGKSPSAYRTQSK